MSSPDTPSHRDPGFFVWWRGLPKEPPGEAERPHPAYRALADGIAYRRSVSLRYRAEQDHQDSILLLYPRQLYKRGGHLYVDGKSYPSGKFQTLRVDRIVEATLTGVSSRNQRSASHRGSAVRTYWEKKTFRRGIIGGAWGVFLDFLVVALIIGLVFQALRWLTGLQF